MRDKKNLGSLSAFSVEKMIGDETGNGGELHRDGEGFGALGKGGGEADLGATSVDSRSLSTYLPVIRSVFIYTFRKT